MRHLLKLELKKFGMTKNIIKAVVAILFTILFLTISLIDSAMDPEQTKDTFESTFLAIGLLMSVIFLVYSATLTASLIISEYNQRTITILFSYPLNKKLLIASKMLLITVFTGLAMLLGYLCCGGFIIAMDATFDMLEGSFTLSYLSDWIPMVISSVIVCSILSWWPFITGLFKKSVPVAIVTSLIAVFARQIMISSNPTNRENLLQIVLVFGITLAATTLTFQRKVTKLD